MLGKRVNEWIGDFDKRKASSEDIIPFLKQVGNDWADLQRLDLTDSTLRQNLLRFHWRLQHLTTQNERNRYLRSAISNIEEAFAHGDPPQLDEWHDVFDDCLKNGYELPTRPSLAKNKLFHQSGQKREVLLLLLQLRAGLPEMEPLEKFLIGTDVVNIDSNAVLQDVERISSIIHRGDAKQMLDWIYEQYRESSSKPPPEFDHEDPVIDDHLAIALHRLYFHLRYGFTGVQQEASRPFRSLLIEQIKRRNLHVSPEHWNELFMDWVHTGHQLPLRKTLGNDPLITQSPYSSEVLRSANVMGKTAKLQSALKTRVSADKPKNYVHPQESAFPSI